MAPVRSDTRGAGSAEDCDRKTRKPLVEKKRRARINESLQELRVLIADADLQSKMENAEVLEMTVRRVESILTNRAQESDAVSREACERFAAGYIQCMHDVHTFVSSCPGIDASEAAELLSHLLQSMPLNDEDRLRSAYTALVSPAPSTASSDDLCSDLCSDLDETDTEQSHVSSSEEDVPSLPSLIYPRSVWRPW
ncbi:putative transcription cofactor HES-6-like [Scophthalmus maximus]|uniref:Putative transcription cofactor HES-6-like n=1 Tax=Scophthalmus maximus TaxID=52904 RepID=A0A2U9BJV1_SCOMX|nr:putative transcription cofactor HES-6-like [Scophthalmus maximus]